MAISIPGLSLSILRQQTTVQAGLPLLISGRFTAFGLGVPTFIRVFLEGPSYDPQLRSFDTFASPFSGDYSTNVIAEKDGQYNVYAQAFPPPLIPTGPPFPEAMMLLPPFAESTRPPLVVGFPFDGGVDALLPDGTRQRLTAPPMQPIEFRPIITVAPGITVTAPGVPAAYPRIPAYPPAVPVPPPAVPPVEVITRAAVDDIRFSPEEINPGMEATGVLSWRNTGDAPHLFDTVFYLVSPVGVRYGPLQVNQDISANPQVPATQSLRLSTAGMPSGIYSVVAEIYDSTTGVLLTAITLPSRLSIREIAPPVVPIPPPPVVPEVPTIDILGTPSLNLPRQLTIGDVWSGSVGLPTFGTIPYFVEARLLLRDPTGLEYVVAQGGRTLYSGETLQVPVNYNTSGFSGGNYTILMGVFDQFGQQVANFPMGFLTMIEAIVPPEIPTAPTLPTADMFATPFVNLPTEVEIGEVWSGNISIPTRVPFALQALPSLPSFPVDIGLQLQSPTGQLFDVGASIHTFMPGQPINLPINFNTGVLPEEGIYNLILNISDLQGNPLFSNVIGWLRARMPFELPEIPTAPPLPTADMFATPFVNLPTEVEIGEIWSGNISIPTRVPFALQALPSLPSFPVNAGLQLQSPTGQLFDVATYRPTFTPGQTISLPVNFNTGVLPQEGMHNLIMNISDLQGNPLFSNIIGSLLARMPFEVPVPHAGTIIKKELEYNESRRLIPAYNVPQGERGKVHIWGRNDMPIRQKLGIHWIVQDPDGLVAEDYQDWQFARMSPGASHEFISPGRFDLNKPGNWTISISLSMNPDAPLPVDSYSGVLCTVTPIAPPPEAPPAEYTLEVTIEPPGAGLVLISPKAPYSAGEVVTLVTTPNPGYEFDHWGGWPPYPGIQSTSDTLNITMTANWWVVAAFREVAPPAAPPTPPECTPGDSKCVRYDLYVCSAEGKWVLSKRDAPQCQYGW